MLFDKDHSNSIDVVELGDAMKALGIHLNKAEVLAWMDRVDKDGSGSIDKSEFVALMTSILDKRNEMVEMQKVFRMYDNDDDGVVSAKNLWESADWLDMDHLVDDERLETMIELADYKGQGGIDRDDFMRFMDSVGLLN